MEPNSGSASMSSPCAHALRQVMKPTEADGRADGGTEAGQSSVIGGYAQHSLKGVFTVVSSQLSNPLLLLGVSDPNLSAKSSQVVMTTPRHTSPHRHLRSRFPPTHPHLPIFAAFAPQQVALSYHSWKVCGCTSRIRVAG